MKDNVMNTCYNALVSIIVPVYKVEEYLEQCVNSLLYQTYTNIEIILVDDGSPDKCPILCDELKKRDDRIKVIHKKNGGLSSARNEGIVYSTGEYLFFLDSDDYLSANAIQIMVENAEKNQSDLCFCDAVSFTDDGDVTPEFSHLQYIRSRDYGTNSGISMATLLMRTGEFKASAALLLIKTNLLKDNSILFYDGILHEDNLFTVRVFLASKRCSHIHEGLYHRRVHSNSIMTSQFNEKNFHGYYVCVTELIKLYCNRTDLDNAFLIMYIKMLCSVINNKYHSFEKKTKIATRDEYKSLRKQLRKQFYYMDYKLFVEFNFCRIFAFYQSVKRRGKLR